MLGVLYTVKMCAYSTVHTECEGKEGLNMLHRKSMCIYCVNKIMCTLKAKMHVPVLCRERMCTCAEDVKRQFARAF